MQEWTSDALYHKARSYCRHAFSVGPQSELFPLLASLALEMLGKAALAYKHPALISDNRDDGRGLLYAFGIPIKGTAHTVVAKVVFNRLNYLIPEFTDEDENACLLLAERRNRELHTGEFAYSDFKNGQWLPSFYRITRILCAFMSRDLKDLLGPAHAREANEVTAGERTRVQAAVVKRRLESKEHFAALRTGEIEARRKESEPTSDWDGGGGLFVYAVECPVCKSKGRLTLREMAERPHEIVEDKIFIDKIYSPKRFDCGVCDFYAEGTAELAMVDMADQITRTSEVDPKDLFDTEEKLPVDPRHLDDE